MNQPIPKRLSRSAKDLIMQTRGDGAPVFHVESILDGTHILPQHASVSALWKHKWRAPCSRNQYPFFQGSVADFDVIFERLVELSNDDNSILSNPELYASAFLPVGDALFEEAEVCAHAGNAKKAEELYLRASVVYRIARFPIIRWESKNSFKAWENCKRAFLKASTYWSSPAKDVAIPFKHKDLAAGDLDADIQVYLRCPTGKKPVNGWPVILYICGLDAYRTDGSQEIDAHLSQAFAVIALEIPGTGDCPANAKDAKSSDRLFDSVFEWLSTAGKTVHGLSDSTVFARGISTGSYYAIRLAHTHANRLAGVVPQGSWSHFALSPQWLSRVDRGEYPFGLSSAFVYRLGYDSIEEALKDDISTKYSLHLSGLLDQPSCPLLLVNGIEDSVFPIEDTWIVADHGRPKNVRVILDAGHMGRPHAASIVYDWLKERLQQQYQNSRQMSTPLKLVSVNNAPDRARRLIGRIIADVSDQYSIIHAANVDQLDSVQAVLEAVRPDLVFTASMWTPEQSLRCIEQARAVNPQIKTLSLPQGLQVEHGPDAVIAWIKQQLPDLMS